MEIENMLKDPLCHIKSYSAPPWERLLRHCAVHGWPGAVAYRHNAGHGGEDAENG